MKHVLNPYQVTVPGPRTATVTVVSPSGVRVGLRSVGGGMQDKGAQGLFKQVLVPEVLHCEIISSQSNITSLHQHSIVP